MKRDCHSIRLVYALQIVIAIPISVKTKIMLTIKYI